MPTSTPPFDDVQCIQQQCGVPLDDAVELYNKCNGDIVLAITTHFDASAVDRHAKKQVCTPAQGAINALRKMANEKDTILNQIMKQKPSSEATDTPPAHSHPQMPSDGQAGTDDVRIEEIEEIEDVE